MSAGSKHHAKVAQQGWVRRGARYLLSPEFVLGLFAGIIVTVPLTQYFVRILPGPSPKVFFLKWRPAPKTGCRVYVLWLINLEPVDYLNLQVQVPGAISDFHVTEGTQSKVGSLSRSEIAPNIVRDGAGECKIGSTETDQTPASISTTRLGSGMLEISATKMERTVLYGVIVLSEKTQRSDPVTIYHGGVYEYMKLGFPVRKELDFKDKETDWGVLNILGSNGG